ncbi:MAG: hypothetical protein AAB723_02555, partial [Patescibacteria group bacterium]
MKTFFYFTLSTRPKQAQKKIRKKRVPFLNFRLSRLQKFYAYFAASSTKNKLPWPEPEDSAQ